MKTNPLLSALYLASPSLPIGAFAYSQGLESAIDMGWVTDESSLQQWLGGVLLEGLTQLELPILVRCLKAAADEDKAALCRWNDILYANRETKELLLEEEQLGQSLLRLMSSLEKVSRDSVPEKPAYLVMYAVACDRLGLDELHAMTAFLWGWLENQVTVACKTIPLGQTSAQKVLMAVMPLFEESLSQARHVNEEKIGATLPGLVMASAFHETQYSRLFRS